MHLICTVPSPHLLGRALISASAGFVSLAGRASLVSISDAILFLRSEHVYLPLEFEFRGKVVLEREHGDRDAISCLLRTLCIILYWSCMEGEFEQVITKTRLSI